MKVTYLVLSCAALFSLLAGCGKNDSGEQQAIHALLEQVKADYADEVKKLKGQVTELQEFGRPPIGAILAWMPDPSQAKGTATGFPEPPSGYKICRKYTDDDPGTPFNETLIPDLTDRFIKGLKEGENPGELRGTTGFPSHTHGLSSNPKTGGGVICARVGNGNGIACTTARARKWEPNYNPIGDDGSYRDMTTTSSLSADVNDWRPAYVSVYYIIRVK